MLNEMAQWVAGHMLVGISSHQAFNRALRSSTQAHSGWQDADVAFFVGAYGTEGFVAGPLRERQTVEMPPWPFGGNYSFQAPAQE